MKKEMIGFCDGCNSETDTCDAQGRFRCIDCQQSDLIAVAQARKGSGLRLEHREVEARGRRRPHNRYEGGLYRCLS